MKEPDVYKYEVGQEDGWWIVTVPELGLTTQARHLRDTDRMARSIVSLHLEKAPEKVEVFRSNIIGLPQRVADAVIEANAARNDLAVAQASSGEATLRAARELVRAGVPLRDAGYLLGISHQRISQLVGSSADKVLARSTRRRAATTSRR